MDQDTLCFWADICSDHESLGEVVLYGLLSKLVNADGSRYISDEEILAIMALAAKR